MRFSNPQTILPFFYRIKQVGPPSRLSALAFDGAMADYPVCASEPGCMRFAGDENFTPIGIEAGFGANCVRGKMPLTVRFTDKSTGRPTRWLWHFGDGETSLEQHPSHTYSHAGTYAVTLEASNGGDSDTESKSEYIHVFERARALAWELLLR